ncbi:hypothetical protein GSI_05138 [Ganoderma sinense ZZ0214-1]|uniref:Uncharacterized protein n=1 Tax=Ganoderma sinense ZZ0214-1 TaxID=1077348 RepID=A0A2G8SF84_9APHY|nr:hypothetical protein GSI_05138 [Ganoderma sinense ZZ0214-1]
MSSDTPLSDILSPQSPTMASAVFGSSPRTRRPSIPHLPSGSVSQQPTSPPHQGKALPPLPEHAQPQSQTQTRSPRSKRKTKTSGGPRGRPDSPDVETMIKRTPRPRRTSSVTFQTNSNSPIGRTRSATGTGMAVPSSWRGPGKRQGLDEDSEDSGMLLDKDASMDEKMLERDGSESDSSIDIHTPLPEDEDAPSLLTRRLIKTNLERQPSVYSTTSRALSQLSKSTSVGNLSRAPSAFSPSPPTTRSLSRSVSSTFSQNRLSGADSDSITSVDLPRPMSRSRTQSNASASSHVSSGSRESSTAAPSVTSSPGAPARTGVPRPLRLPQTAGIQSSKSVTRSTSIVDSRPPVSSATARIAGPPSSPSLPPPRNRTVSNPGSRPGHGHSNVYASGPTRSAAAPAVSRILPPRSLSTSVMAPVRSMSMSTLSPVERSSIASAAAGTDPLSAFPLPPSLATSQSVGGLPRPSSSLAYAQKPASSISGPSPPSSTRPQVGLRPRPRTGTGMIYRNSSYSSFLDTSRASRTSSVMSTGKEVGVM